ncbi:MAG: N-acetylmuramoyl-L-alanine amidase [Chitinophagaceae bacterium]|nr:MAG: N-acetylmuramoyl-L-alanine amidase [Chitinophagaceae bacterium]
MSMLKNFLFLVGITFSALTITSPGFSQAKKLRTIVVDAGHGGSDPGAVGQYEGSLRAREKDITLSISNKLVAELKKQLPDLNIVPTRTTDVFQTPKEKAKIANDAKGDLFLCIHADAVAMKTGKRQIGTKTVTRYKTTYKGKGKSRKKIRTPYKAVEPVYEYFKIPTKRNGTSVWIFAAHKTSDKLKAIREEEGDYEMDGHDDTTETRIDYSSPEGRAIAQIYAKRYQEKSDLIATLVNEEVEKTGRPALGVNQRQVGIWVLQATNMPAILIETGFISNPDDERYLSSEKGQQELAEVITQAVIRYRAMVENTKPGLTK